MQRSNKLVNRTFLLASAACVGMIPLTPARAQQDAADAAAPASFSDLQEITVTARRRSESLQNVPIAVTVLTSEDIARGGVQSVADFANLAPNVTFDNTLNLGTNFLTIRGQTQAQYGPPPAAIVIDGVLQMSPLQFNVDEFDLQQVEVLKGPQGAIYGRNAIAGAINLTTLKPGPDFEAHALAGWAHGDEEDGKASISGPVIPGLLYVLGGVSFEDRRGQVPNITTGTWSDKFRDETGRLRVVLTPADNVEADVKYTYSDTHGHDPDYVTSRSGNPAISSDPLDSNRAGTNPRTLEDLSGRLNWDLGYATSTLTLAYVNVDETLTEDLDYMPIDFLAADQQERQTGFSQELRLTSPSSGRLHWLVGAYHMRLTGFRDAQIYFDPYYLGLAPAPTQANVLLAGSADNDNENSAAGFGQLQYDLTSTLGLEADLRYDSDRLRQTSPGSPAQQANFSKWQPKGTLTYKPISDLTLYGSVGQGFRSGTFNATGATFGEPVVRPEVATTYEIGAKTHLLEHRLTLNAALYQTYLKDGQFNLFDAPAATNVRININKTSIRGFELESALRVTDSLRMNASVGYTDPRITAFTPPANYPGDAASYIGNAPPRVARETANLGLDFDIPVSTQWSYFLRPEYRYIGSYYWNLENSYERPAYNLLNIRTGIHDTDNHYAVTVYAKNALNTKITPEYQPYIDSGLPTGKDVYYPPVGAIFGVELTYRY